MTLVMSTKPAWAAVAGSAPTAGAPMTAAVSATKAAASVRTSTGLGLDEVAGDRRVDRDAWAGGRRDDNLLQVAALGRRRLGPQDLIEGRTVVLGECRLVERRLADDEVQIGLLVDAEVDLAALDVVDRLGDVRRHGAGLRVRHQATGAED